MPRTNLRGSLAFVLSILIVGTPAWADSRSLHWSDLSSFVESRTVAVTLPDGAQIEGQAVLVDEQRLVVNVRKTSDPNHHPIGHQSVPREQLGTLVVNRPTKRWRIIGTSLGAVVGVPVGGVAALEKDGLFNTKNSGIALIFAAIGGLAAIGFLAGWAGDRRKTTVTIVPDTAPSEPRPRGAA